ncbi:GNAT family N-acetyltransferase [Roseateles sp. NT4]|uniref:GNAT family N-acetyltransferase n=1 Tax=Roseateles sp. NT4 TaxID=3453715 RepID=UPI003EEC1E8B
MKLIKSQDSRAVRLLQTDGEVIEALQVLRCASQRMRRMGVPYWQPRELGLGALIGRRICGELIGGFENSKLCATMQLHLHDTEFWPEAIRGDAIYLHKLAVAERHARQGWGDTMVSWAAVFAVRESCSRLRLDVVPGALERYYELLGFQPVGEVRSARAGGTVIKMERLLKM